MVIKLYEAWIKQFNYRASWQHAHILWPSSIISQWVFKYYLVSFVYLDYLHVTFIKVLSHRVWDDTILFGDHSGIHIIWYLNETYCNLYLIWWTIISYYLLSERGFSLLWHRFLTQHNDSSAAGYMSLYTDTKLPKTVDKVDFSTPRSDL